VLTHISALEKAGNEEPGDTEEEEPQRGKSELGPFCEGDILALVDGGIDVIVQQRAALLIGVGHRIAAVMMRCS
jgi:hypothetical protein